ncbi:hypothetical protein [Mucilaginibacter dorajii]|nr:hypothetical protein [Mucilaginibacter dorajii]MCS3732441.1 hypothetical protein [Mucilaginibacter dorajii]
MADLFTWYDPVVSNTEYTSSYFASSAVTDNEDFSRGNRPECFEIA